MWLRVAAISGAGPSVATVKTRSPDCQLARLAGPVRVQASSVVSHDDPSGPVASR